MSAQLGRHAYVCGAPPGATGRRSGSPGTATAPRYHYQLANLHATTPDRLRGPCFPARIVCFFNVCMLILDFTSTTLRTVGVTIDLDFDLQVFTVNRCRCLRRARIQLQAIEVQIDYTFF